MKLTTRIITLGFKHGEFRIARGAVTGRKNLIVEVEHDGVTGIGEAAPISHYDNETAESAEATVRAAEPMLGDDPFLIEDVVDRVAKAFPTAHAAITAIDLALHDLVGKRLNTPVCKLYGLSPEKTPLTSFTIGIAEPAVMAERAAQAAKIYKVLKIKVGVPGDMDCIRAIRDVTDIPLRVDANCGWTKEEAVDRISALVPYDVEFIEQPIPEGDNAALRFVRERVEIPIMSDESSITLADLPALVGCVDMINIKLMKCGGLREALRMIHFADAHQLPVMLGCMSETSLAITAAAHLSPMVEYADLDGNLMIDRDPFVGVVVEDGKLVLPDAPGLGVTQR